MNGKLILFLTLCFVVIGQSATALPENKIQPELQLKMLGADQEEFIPVKIRLTGQFDTYGFMEKNSSMSKKERRALLIEEASLYAATRQKEILAHLEDAAADGFAREIRPLWIVNMITVKTVKGVIEKIAALEDVQKITWDRIYPVEMVHDAATPAPGDGGYADIGWGVVKMGAPDAWALGFEGQGVVIANIDSGTDYTHPDLSSHIWNNEGEIPNNNIDDDNNGFIDDTMGWDFYDDDKDPMDLYGHGTSTAGVAVGDGTNGTQTGVAPKALLMILRVNAEGDHIAAQQYALENGADVATSSYSYKWYFSPKPDYHAFRDASVMEMAAGLIHTNSSSNDGSSVGVPWNISAPAMVPPPWLHPGQTWKGGVAGTMGIGGATSSDQLYSYSPIGPCTWEDLKIYDPGYPHFQKSEYWDYPHSTGDSLIKVDVVCPTEVPSTTKGGGYTTSFGGTSAATPHCGGACCLVLSANPELEPADVCKAIKMNAKDLGAPGLDTSFGAGRVNVFEAVINVLCTLKADNTEPAPGDTVSFELTGPADAGYALLFSQALGKLVVPRVLTLDLDLPIVILKKGVLDGVGTDSYDLPLPNCPGISGLELHFQTVTDDTSGATGLTLVSLHETLVIQ